MPSEDAQNNIGRRWLIFFSLLTALLLQACAQSPARDLAAQQGWEERDISGAPFRHQVFFNRQAGNVLHIYLEGDGRAYINPKRVSLDPTPRQPLMLQLMTLDKAPAAYLGRPCYHDLEDPYCSAQWWTTKRYAPAVVDSLNTAIDQLAKGYSGIVLLGHSGGATLAMLIASRRNDVRELVALAPNLDTGAWATRHGYSPLTGSLNPAQQAPLPAAIRQQHYLGTRDGVITADMLRPTLERQPDAQLQLIDGFDHNCCWQQLWPGILAALGS